MIYLTLYFKVRCYISSDVFMFLFKDVMNKVRSNNILDVNLEKSRVKELVSACKEKIKMLFRNHSK